MVNTKAQRHEGTKNKIKTNADNADDTDFPQIRKALEG